MRNPDSSRDITVLLHNAQGGGHLAIERLTEAVYTQLRQIAASQMRQERSQHILQPTALVHEAYLRLFQNQQVEWRNRSHFFAIAASQMRRILIDHGRRQSAGKRNGIHLELQEANAKAVGEQYLFGDVEALLGKLQDQDPSAARVVELKVYAGFTDDEIARMTGLTKSKVRAHWAFAKAWLAARLSAARGNS